MEGINRVLEMIFYGQLAGVKTSYTETCNSTMMSKETAWLQGFPKRNKMDAGLNRLINSEQAVNESSGFCMVHRHLGLQ